MFLEGTADLHRALRRRFRAGVNHHPLFANRKLRVADDVDEQDVRDLKLDLLFNFSGHLTISRIVRKSLSHIKRGELGHFAAEDEHEHDAGALRSLTSLVAGVFFNSTLGVERWAFA